MDSEIRCGQFHCSVDPPYVTGCDLVGTVVSCPAQDKEGEGEINGKVTLEESTIRVGDRVCAVGLALGGNARYTSVLVSSLIRVPTDLDPWKVACLLRTYVTAYQCLHRSGARGMKRGSRVLVTGGEGENFKIKPKMFCQKNQDYLHG